MSLLSRHIIRIVPPGQPAPRLHPSPILWPRRALLRRGLFLVAALVGALTLGTLPGPEAQAADTPGAAGARQFINELANKAIAVMAVKSESDADRSQMFQALFVSSFNLPAIGEHVLGRYWHIATPDQRDKFLKLFQQQEVLVWAGRFKSYNGQRLEVESATQGQGGNWEVRSHIDQPNGGSTIPLVWTLSLVDGNWRVSDINVAGASMALTLHQDFASVLESNGGKVDALLAAMQRKIAQLRSPG